MKKRNGFTLIELLAVIVILAIIALIATPIVLNIIEKARTSAYQDSAYGLIEAAKLKYVEGILDGTNSAKTYTFDGTASSGLEFSGSAPDSGELKVDANGNIALAVVYGNVCYKKDYTESKITQTDDATNCTFGGSTPNEPSTPTVPTVTYKCKRANPDTLHEETCTQTSNFCYAAGYTSGNKGTTIVYGNKTVTEGVLTSGDAYDCDVNGDGTYDATTERFYYVSDLYNTTTQTFDNNYAVLVYYNNTSLGVADNTSAGGIAYYGPALENWYGPVTAIANLPTVSQWLNVSLVNASRAILTEKGTTSTSGKTLPTAFEYTGKAARLLTAQEVNSACGITVGSSIVGELDNCNYLLENTTYSDSSLGIGEYWLETASTFNTYGAWHVAPGSRFVYRNVTTANFGVRPAIEVSKTDIEI